MNEKANFEPSSLAKKLRQPRKPNIGACMLERSRACATCARLSQFFLARVVEAEKSVNKGSTFLCFWPLSLESTTPLSAGRNVGKGGGAVVGTMNPLKSKNRKKTDKYKNQLK